MLVSLPAFKSGALLSKDVAEVSKTSALVHAIIFIILHHYLGKSIMRAMGLIPASESTTPKSLVGIMDLVCGTLFFLLTPGVLLTLPPVDLDFSSSKYVLLTGKTTIPSIVVHAFVFVLAHHYIVAAMSAIGIHEP